MSGDCSGPSWFFDEPFNRQKIVGLTLVVAGVFFIGLSKG